MVKVSIQLVFLSFLLFSCGGGADPEPGCDESLQVVVQNSMITSTCSSADGSIEVKGSGGVEPLMFSINNNEQQSGIFSNLTAGTYTVVVKDANDCMATVDAVVDSPEPTITASIETLEDTKCFGGNGEVTIVASGGVEPYDYSLGIDFVSSPVFSLLDSGSYDIVVRDAEGCLSTVSTYVEGGDTGTSYVDDIDPIIMTNCALSDCHNGDTGADQDWTNFTTLQSHAQEVKTRTQDGSMPPTGGLSNEEIALIACWVNEGAKDN